MTDPKKASDEKAAAAPPPERPRPNVNAVRPEMVMGLESLDLREKKK